MARLLTLALLALLAVAEVATILALVDAVGGPMALALLGIDVLVGLLVIRWGAASQPPQRGWRIGAGAVIALPGFVLDAVGLALLVPPLQRWLSGHVLRGTESALRRAGVSVVTVTDATGVPRTTVVPGDVIPGTVVEESGTDVPPGAPGDPTTAHEDAAPRVVRGEIADS